MGGVAAAAARALGDVLGPDATWLGRRWSKVEATLEPGASGGAELCREGRRYALNRNAALLWRLCDGGHRGTDLVAALRRETGIGRARATDDVRAFLGALAAEGLVRWS
jgi:hypothetical protein